MGDNGKQEKTLATRVDEAVHKAAYLQAINEGKTLSEWLREAVDAKLEREAS